jgi:hypothetical protein
VEAEKDDMQLAEDESQECRQRIMMCTGAHVSAPAIYSVKLLAWASVESWTKAQLTSFAD